MIGIKAKTTDSILAPITAKVTELRALADQKFAERDNHILAAEEATTKSQDAEQEGIKAAAYADKLNKLLEV